MNVPLTPSLQVRLEDLAGRPAAGRVTVTLDPNPCEWPLGGTMARRAVGGVATFEDLTLGQVATGYHLTVRSGTLEAVTGGIDVVAKRTPGGTLSHVNTLCSKPNSQEDAESLEYIAEDDVFWLADDDKPSIFAVDRGTGVYRRSVTAADFVAAFPTAGVCEDGDGDPTTSCSYVDEFEHLAWDPGESALYVMNTVNDPQATPVRDRPAIFKLRHGACADCWNFESWKPLPIDAQYEGLASIQGSLYVAIGRRVYEFDYEANRVLTTNAQGDSLPPAYDAPGPIRGLHYNGTYVWALINTSELIKIQWDTGVVLSTYDLATLGMTTPKGLEIIAGELYVLEGDPPNPIYLLRDPAGL